MMFTIHAICIKNDSTGARYVNNFSPLKNR